jgi:gamma-glutamyl:cysteine ligase YbdK (ATP-grasp superfamily)
MKDVVTMEIRVPGAFAALVKDLARLNHTSPERQLVDLTLCNLELEVSENRVLAVRYGLGGRGFDREQLRALAGLESEAAQ